MMMLVLSTHVFMNAAATAGDINQYDTNNVEWDIARHDPSSV